MNLFQLEFLDYFKSPLLWVLVKGLSKIEQIKIGLGLGAKEVNSPSDWNYLLSRSLSLLSSNYCQTYWIEMTQDLEENNDKSS